MAMIKFFCDSGANAHSCRESQWIDVSKLGFSDEEWSELTDDDKYEMAEDWSNQMLNIGYKER